MATIDDLNDFHQFAGARLANGGADSLDALLANWKARREYEESVAEIRDAIPDMEAGKGRTIEEVDSEIRAKLGFSRKVS